MNSSAKRKRLPARRLLLKPRSVNVKRPRKKSVAKKRLPGRPPRKNAVRRSSAARKKLSARRGKSESARKLNANARSVSGV